MISTIDAVAIWLREHKNSKIKIEFSYTYNEFDSPSMLEVKMSAPNVAVSNDIEVYSVTIRSVIRYIGLSELTETKLYDTLNRLYKDLGLL